MPFIFAKPNAGPDVLASMPTLATASQPGEWQTLVNRGKGTLVMQDESVLAGSKLKLRTPTLHLPPGGALQMVWDGSFWVELARSTVAGSGLSYLHVADYGAAGDGVTDDGAALQAALDDSYSQGRPLYFDFSTYLTNRKLVNQGSKMIGCIGAGGTTILAGAAMTSVMEVNGTADVRDITFQGNRLATHCLELRLASYSRFTNVQAYEAVVDGFHLTSGLGLGNDAVVLRDCLAQLCGKIFLTAGRATPDVGATKVITPGTIATTTGGSSTILTGTGTHFLSMGIRPGDVISVGSSHLDANLQVFQIASVDSDTQITVLPLNGSVYNTSGKDFAVYVGDGYHEEISNENSNNRIEHFLARNNAGSGIVSMSLYGVSGQDWQLDFNGSFPVVVGASNLVAPAAFRASGIYSESFDEMQPGVVLIGDVNGFFIDTIKAAVPAVVSKNPSLISGGVVVNDQNNVGVYMTPYGDFTSIVPSRILTAPVAASVPPDNALSTSQGTLYVDEAAKTVYMKVKLSDGVTIKLVALGTYT